MNMQAINSIPKRIILNIIKPLHVVSLDAMGTVIRMKENPSDVYVRFGEERGISADPQAVAFRFRELRTHMRAREKCFAYYGGGPEHWWSEVVRGCFFEYSRDPEVIGKLCKDLFDYYATAEPWELIEEDIVSSFKTIKDHGLKLAIASDFDYRLHSIFEKFNLHSFIDVWVLSGEQGVSKLEHKTNGSPIFQRLLDLFEEKNLGKYQPREIVHIGNDVFADFIQARDFGAQCLLLMKQHDPDDPSKINPRFVSFRNRPADDQITPSVSAFVKACVSEN
uniref:Haloacid dehalogenase-like hydrolase domain-containing protein 3 n=1 Tax=Ditylenchus dipsaci TaxID=166011 RepID=A0A915ESJ9_9BILA